MTQPKNVLEGLQETAVKVLSLLNPAERICSHLLRPHETHPDSSEMKDVNGEEKQKLFSIVSIYCWLSWKMVGRSFRV